MPKKSRIESIRRDSVINNCIEALNNQQFTSVKTAARVFKVSRSTLRDRMSGTKFLKNTREPVQNLSERDEKDLIRYIRKLTNTGFKANRALVIETANVFRTHRARLNLNAPPPSNLKSMNYSWLRRFQERYPEIKSIRTRKIDSVRFDGLKYNTTDL